VEKALSIHLMLIKIGMVVQWLAVIGFMIAGFLLGFCKEHATWPYSWLVFNIFYFGFFVALHVLEYVKRYNLPLQKANWKSECNKHVFYK